MAGMIVLMTATIITPPIRVFDVGKDPRSGLHSRPAPSSPWYGVPRISRRRTCDSLRIPSIQQISPIITTLIPPPPTSGTRIVVVLARGEQRAWGPRTGEGSQIRMPKVKMATRRVSETVRRTRSIVGMPSPTTGVGAIFGGDLASCLTREAGLELGLSMVAIGGVERHRRRVGRRGGFGPNLRCLKTDATPRWLPKT